MASNSSPAPETHAFEHPVPTASRSPCPALNAAASHGFLPRSGRNITFLQLLNGIRNVYNVSLPLGLVLALGGFLSCGRNGRPTIPFLGTIDLHDFARHGRIEHDGSLAHADTPPHEVFAPTTPDQALLDSMLKEAKDGKDLNLEDLARTRNKRDTALMLQGRGLDAMHAEISRGEIALILSVIGDGTSVSTHKLQQWMGEDRLPDGWTKPQKTQGLIETFLMARRVGVAVEAAKSAGTDKSK